MLYVFVSGLHGVGGQTRVCRSGSATAGVNLHNIILGLTTEPKANSKIDSPQACAPVPHEQAQGTRHGRDARLASEPD